MSVKVVSPTESGQPQLPMPLRPPVTPAAAGADHVRPRLPSSSVGTGLCFFYSASKADSGQPELPMTPLSPPAVQVRMPTRPGSPDSCARLLPCCGRRSVLEPSLPPPTADRRRSSRSSCQCRRLRCPCRTRGNVVPAHGGADRGQSQLPSLHCWPVDSRQPELPGCAAFACCRCGRRSVRAAHLLTPTSRGGARSVRAARLAAAAEGERGQSEMPVLSAAGADGGQPELPASLAAAGPEGARPARDASSVRCRCGWRSARAARPPCAHPPRRSAVSPSCPWPFARPLRPLRPGCLPKLGAGSPPPSGRPLPPNGSSVPTSPPCAAPPPCSPPGGGRTGAVPGRPVPGCCSSPLPPSCGNGRPSSPGGNSAARASAQAGITGKVTAESADGLVRAATSFLELVRRLVHGLPIAGEAHVA